MPSTTLNIRISSEDKELIQSYAKLHGRAAGELVREAILRQIEDEFDLKEFAEAKAEFDKDPVTYTHEEVMRKYGLR
jgi:predicted DNA-binding protein